MIRTVVGMSVLFLGVAGASHGETVLKGAGAGSQDLLVASTNTDRILRYGLETGVSKGLLDPLGLSEINGPQGMTLGPSGNVFVCSAFTDSVLEFSPITGQYVGPFIRNGGEGLLYPQEAVFHGGFCYVTAYNTGSVLRYDAVSGDFVDVFVAAGEGGLLGPTGLVFGQDGDLYVCSSITHSVLRFDGETSAFVGSAVASGEGGLSQPVGLMFSTDGSELWVAGADSGAIHRFSSLTGASLGHLVTPPALTLFSPRFFRRGADSDLLVANFPANEVQRYSALDGSYLGSLVPPGAGGLVGPYDLVIVPALEDTCPADLNDDGVVGAGDLSILLGFWGSCEGACLGDVDRSGAVDAGDLAEVLGGWGACPAGDEQ